MKSRDITEDEIIKITKECKIREKAFLTIMRQSGLLPHTIKELKIENLEKILNPNTPIPCKVEIPNEKFPIFIGHEAVEYIKRYLETRATKETLKRTSLLFTAKNNPNKKINTKNVSREFARAARKLKKDTKINYKTESRKPSELRLSSLTRFYKNKTESYLADLHNNTASKDIEFCRKLYKEKAMRNLEIETPTPIEIRTLIKQQQELENKLEKIENIIHPKTIQHIVPPEDLKYYQKEIEEYLEQMKEDEERIEWEKERIKWEKEHPEEAKQQQQELEKLKEEWNKRIHKYLDEHPEARIQEQSLQIEHLKTRVNELEKTLREITETLLKQKPPKKSAKKHKGNPPTLG